MNSPNPEDQCLVKFTSDTPHFFKIILDDADIGKLRLPPKFARRCGSGLLSPVSLKAPTGASWEVELEKCDDGTWLHNGWSEFAKHYSISYGSFLVFRYEGNSHFHVIIFDKTATEISYPYGGEFQGHHAMEDTNDDDISVEILDDIRPTKKVRVRSPSPSSRPHKTMKSTPNISSRHSPKISNGFKHEIPDLVFDAKRQGKCPHQATLTGEERTKALLQASSFESENPFFTLVMQPSYVHDSYQPKLPVKFCDKYLPKHADTVILSVCQRKARSVVFLPSTRPLLSGGWKDFVKENQLEVGDVCVFELIIQTTRTFNVEIFRRVQDEKTGMFPEKDGEQGKSSTSSRLQNQTSIVPCRKQALTPTRSASVAQRLTSFKSANPFCLITTKPSCIKTVNVSYSFIKKYIKQDEVNLIVENVGKVWPVKVLAYQDYKIAQLSVGWPVFVKENSVKAGDGCAFELINREDAVLRVHIFRKSAE